MTMGLLDILNGMQNGPRGPSAPAEAGSNDGKNEGRNEGMSPITMAILAMLAYKAVKHFGGSKDDSASTTANKAPQQIPAPEPTQTTQASNEGGGLNDLLKGGLGGLLAGGAAGGVLGSVLGNVLGGNASGGAAGNGGLSGGIGDLLKQLQQNGQGDVADSWVGSGQNKTIAPNDLANALGADQINALTSRTGLSRDELMAELSEHLPDVINQFTPNGRVPSDNELSRWL
jgi:uncharacterized protein YidB (DUF937 family)